VIALVVALLLVVSGVVTAQRESFQPVTVRVMTFNIWVGGKLVDFGKVAESIASAEADVVLLQEAGGNTRAIADMLGWQHVSERMQVIARYPLIDPPGADGDYILVQTAPGEVFAVANVHLPSDPYGPYLVRDGMTLEQVMQNEADTRQPVIDAHLAALSALIEAGMPLVLAGDFNVPSHRDWTEAVMALRPEIAYPVEWAVTIAVEAAGLVDTYRAIYPDPVVRPGITWTYGYPYPRLRADEVIDRIDLLFATPTIEVLDSQIVGSDGTADVDITVTPYPSDHRAVVSTLRLTPVAPPLFTALERRVVRVGEPIVVRYHVPAGEAESDRIFLVRADADVSDAVMSLPPMEADFFGAVTFGSWTLAPGAYDAVAADVALQEYARSRFWVVAADARPMITTDRAAYAPGETITVSWQNLPDNRWDWIGVYAAGDAALDNYVGFVYTGSQSSGALALDIETLGELASGEYVVRAMQDDWYGVMAESAFSISE